MMKGPVVAGNVGRKRYAGATHDFPLYARPSQILPPENKYVPFYLNMRPRLPDFVPLGANSYQLVEMPTAGDGISFRLSDRIIVSRLQLRGRIPGPYEVAINGPTAKHLEMFIVYDHAPSGAPLTEDLFDQESIIAESLGMYQNPKNRDRFEFLYRFRYVVSPTWRSAATGPNPATSPGLPYILVDEDLAIDRECVFRAGGGATISDIARGAIYIIIFYDLADGSGIDFYPHVQMNCRVQFGDR